MFQRTVSFIRQFVRKADAPYSLGEGAVAEDERRFWERFPSDLETTCRLSGAGNHADVRAKVRNISMGGINLLVQRSFQVGDLVNIQLPGSIPENPCTALACVVFCKSENKDNWILGCTFSRELTEEDMESFGARRLPHDTEDQRTRKRFQSDRHARYLEVATPDTERNVAQVLNISASGVGLLVPEILENGTLLSVEFQGANPDYTKTLLACVVHITPRGSSRWAIGCNFIRSLSEDDFNALV